MTGVGQVERKTQNRIVKLFSEKLGYTYLGNWHERENSFSIEEEYLRKYLTRKGYSPELINRAVDKLSKAAGNQVDKLYYAIKLFIRKL